MKFPLDVNVKKGANVQAENSVQFLPEVEAVKSEVKNSRWPEIEVVESEVKNSRWPEIEVVESKV